MEKPLQLIIRKATAKDVMILSRLCYDTFYATYRAKNTEQNMREYMNAHFKPEHILSELLDPSTKIFIAKLGVQALGYISTILETDAQNPREKSLQISRFYVDQKFQGSGTGSRLMHKAIQHAKLNGCKKIWLAVWQENQPAISIYRHFGFEISGTTTFQLGDDLQSDFIMTKTL